MIHEREKRKKYTKNLDGELKLYQIITCISCLRLITYLFFNIILVFDLSRALCIIARTHTMQRKAQHTRAHTNTRRHAHNATQHTTRARTHRACADALCVPYLVAVCGTRAPGTSIYQKPGKNSLSDMQT